MPISIDKIPDSTKELLKWKWESRGFKVSFPQFLALYVYAYNKAEEYGFSDPETTVMELFDRIDPDLSYDELKSEIEAYLIPVSAPEMEELEFWKRRAEELEKELKKAVSPKVYEELKRELERVKKRLEEREREIEELKRYGVREEIKEQTKEFEEIIKEYPTDELVASWYALETKPPELSEEEWLARREAIRRELERRKVPKSPITGNFLEPVREWKGIRVPVEMRFWYDPIERRFYRDGRPVTPETIEKAIRMLLKPVEVEKPLPPVFRAPPKPPAFRQPGYRKSYYEEPPNYKQVDRHIELIVGMIMVETGKHPSTMTEEEIEEILKKLEPSYPRQVYYFRWFIQNFPNWRELV